MVAAQSTTLIVQGATTARLVVPVTVQPRCYTVIVTVPPGHSILTLTANPVWLISAESRIVGVVVRSLQLIRYHADGLDELTRVRLSIAGGCASVISSLAVIY